MFRLALINAGLESGIENPLDMAILETARTRGAAVPDLPKADEIPYDFQRKRITVVADQPDEEAHFIVTKGAFDTILGCCDEIATPDGPRPLDSDTPARLDAMAAPRGQDGFRVLAVASRRLSP